MWGTYSIREVLYEVLDRNIAGLELVIEPAGDISISTTSSRIIVESAVGRTIW